MANEASPRPWGPSEVKTRIGGTVLDAAGKAIAHFVRHENRKYAINAVNSVEAMRAVVNAVSEFGLVEDQEYSVYYCPLCEATEEKEGAGVTHRDDCLVLKAKAALALGEGAGT